MLGQSPHLIGGILWIQNPMRGGYTDFFVWVMLCLSLQDKESFAGQVVTNRFLIIDVSLLLTNSPGKIVLCSDIVYVSVTIGNPTFVVGPHHLCHILIMVGKAGSLGSKHEWDVMWCSRPKASFVSKKHSAWLKRYIAYPIWVKI